MRSKPRIRPRTARGPCRERPSTWPGKLIGPHHGPKDQHVLRGICRLLNSRSTGRCKPCCRSSSRRRSRPRAHAYQGREPDTQAVALVTGKIQPPIPSRWCASTRAVSRRRVPLAALRLPRSAEGSSRPHHIRAYRRAHLSALPGRPWHRPLPQDQGLCAARPGLDTVDANLEQGQPIDCPRLRLCGRDLERPGPDARFAS